MSKDFFKVNKGINLRPLSEPPSNPKEGDMYNSNGSTTRKGLWTYQGDDWVPAASPSMYEVNFVHGKFIPLFENRDTQKLTNPSQLPASTGNGSSFSPDGRYLVITHNTSPFITIYERTDNIFSKLDNPANLPTGTGNGVSWSSDGRFLSVAHSTTPFVTTYKVTDGSFSKLDDPANLPTGTGNGVSWSSDGRFLSVAHSTTPFVTTYKREGLTLVKLADPTDLPNGIGFGVNFHLSGKYLSVAHDLTPFVTVYERDGETFTKLPNPTTLPSGQGRGVAFSPCCKYLVVSHNVSPGITVYRLEGSTLVKLVNPIDPVPGIGIGVTFSPTSNIISVACSVSPFILTYDFENEVLTKRPDPSDLPSGIGRSVSYSPDNRFLSIAHTTTPFVTVYETSAKLNIENKTPLVKTQIVDSGPKGEVTENNFSNPIIGLPTGMIIPFAGNNTPPGYLLCDGSTVNRAEYAGLFAVIGTAWGNGDGSSTFHLPDLRGTFLRGKDGGAGRDPNAATRTASNSGGNIGDEVGTVQDHSLQNHDHTYRRPGNSANRASGTSSNSSNPTEGIMTGNGTGSSEGNFSTETRPINASVNFLIKV